MRTLIILSFIAGLALSKTLADYPRNPLDISQYQESELQAADFSDGRLCTPCKQLLTSVKDKLEEIGRYDRETLKPAVKEFCHTYYGKIDKLEQLCETLSEQVLDRLADWIEGENNKIDPERACVVAHLC